MATPASSRASRRLALGRRGEALVAAWYEALDFEVVARNWSCRSGEIDIVARRGRLLVFCEVKARTSAAFGSPLEAVTGTKQARLRRLAAAWLESERHSEKLQNARPRAPGWQVRFDVASVLAGEVEVIEGAF
jgi:putative endonuclease